MPISRQQKRREMRLQQKRGASLGTLSAPLPSSDEVFLANRWPLPPVGSADDALDLGRKLSALTGDGVYLEAAERGEHPLALFRGYAATPAGDLPVALRPRYQAALVAMGPGSALFRAPDGRWIVLPAPHADQMGEMVIG